ncbi:unnamed protein product [Phyllotreta striolata]|uniref:C2H2-type domain-containing protein n=1 Tax=Phyllotreta striolata TaxID=444603 RepID=A0A9N9XLF4_PHYSR|nr:unnamed protein product [Phyllotreta striolata]
MYRPNSMFYQHSIFSEIKTENDGYSFNTVKMSDSSDESFREDLSAPKPIINQVTERAVSNDSKKSKQQKCNVCGKTLSSASSYYVHMKKHSNNKPYHCTHCDASFCRKPYLEVHLRTHTGEKPFECDICQKKFTQKSSLNTHKRSHTGLRPFACEVCFKRFSVKSYLVAHRWSHAASNGIACGLCSTTFHNKSSYMCHMQSHNTAGFKCNSCHKIFAKESFLIRHKTRVHNKSLRD